MSKFVEEAMRLVEEIDARSAAIPRVALMAKLRTHLEASEAVTQALLEALEDCARIVAHFAEADCKETLARARTAIALAKEQE
jgi:hypothetical protein